MTEQKRPVGRPRKIPVSAIVEKDGQQFVSLEDAAKLLGIKPEEEPVKNPDCEPATRGYVKCLLRKIHHHNHAQDICFGLTGIFAIVMWGVTALTTDGWGTSPELLPFGWYAPTGYCLLAAISLTCVAIDLIRSDFNTTIRFDPYPDEIEKWQPPTCERKKDCDE